MDIPFVKKRKYSAVKDLPGFAVIDDATGERSRCAGLVLVGLYHAGLWETGGGNWADGISDGRKRILRSADIL
jgi:hypothetical protein